MPPRKPKPTKPPKPPTEPVPPDPTTPPVPEPTPDPTPIPPIPSGSRDPALWPFDSLSPWNMPLGSGAVFAPSTDPRLIAIQGPWTAINAASWSEAVYIANAADPIRRVVSYPGGVRWENLYEIPDAATPSLPAGGDMHMLTISPDHRKLHEASGMVRQSDGSFVAYYQIETDLYGPGILHNGVRAYGGSAFGGLIRAWEMQQGLISHALPFAVPHSCMKPGPVWPANLEDYQHSDYTGPCPMGTFAAIPPTVDLSTMGLSASGLVVGRALQNYGMYLVDTSANFTLYAEPAADGYLTGARADLGKLRALVRIVDNNGPTSVGGGGTPLVPLAPALA